MGIRLFNTYSRQLEEFTPLDSAGREHRSRRLVLTASGGPFRKTPPLLSQIAAGS